MCARVTFIVSLIGLAAACVMAVAFARLPSAEACIPIPAETVPPAKVHRVQSSTGLRA
jgi:hypothetical protein